MSNDNKPQHTDSKEAVDETMAGEHGDENCEDEGVFIDENDIENSIIVDNTDDVDVTSEEVKDLHLQDNDAPHSNEANDGDDISSEEEENQSNNDDSIFQYTNHTDSVYCVAINKKDPRVVASGGGDDLAYIYHLDTKTVYRCQGHKDSVSQVGFSCDGKLLATGSMDATTMIWECASGRRVCTLEGPSDAVECLAWHPKGNVLFVGSADGSGWMWSAQGPIYMNTFVGHKGPITCASFTLDGRRLVTVSEDATLRVWNPKSAQSEVTISGPHQFHHEGITRFALHPENPNLVLTGGLDHLVCIANLQTGKSLGVLKGHTESVEAVALSTNAFHFAVSGSLDKSIKVWDLNTLQLRQTFHHDGAVVKVIVQPQQPHILYSCAVDCTIRLWDIRNGQLLRTLTGHRYSILDFDVSLDGTLIASCSDDKSVRLFVLHRDSLSPTSTVTTTNNNNDNNNNNNNNNNNK
jgi:WD40 repeat protein